MKIRNCGNLDYPTFISRQFTRGIRLKAHKLGCIPTLESLESLEIVHPHTYTYSTTKVYLSFGPNCLSSKQTLTREVVSSFA